MDTDILKSPESQSLQGINILGRKDSNLRMPGPKPGALPLGDTPMNQAQIKFIEVGIIVVLSNIVNKKNLKV